AADRGHLGPRSELPGKTMTLGAPGPKSDTMGRSVLWTPRGAAAVRASARRRLHARRRALGPRPRRDVVGHDGAHADARAVAHGHAAQDARRGADDGAGADDHRRGEQRLLAHGPLHVADVVVEVDEDDLVLQAGLGPDLDALVGGDHAALAQARAGAEGDRGARAEMEAAAIADAAA